MRAGTGRAPEAQGVIDPGHLALEAGREIVAVPGGVGGGLRAGAPMPARAGGDSGSGSGPGPGSVVGTSVSDTSVASTSVARYSASASALGHSKMRVLGSEHPNRRWRARFISIDVTEFMPRSKKPCRGSSSSSESAPSAAAASASTWPTRASCRASGSSAASSRRRAMAWSVVGVAAGSAASASSPGRAPASTVSATPESAAVAAPLSAPPASQYLLCCQGYAGVSTTRPPAGYMPAQSTGTPCACRAPSESSMTAKSSPPRRRDGTRRPMAPRSRRSCSMKVSSSGWGEISTKVSKPSAAMARTAVENRTRSRRLRPQ
ncbi:hypothetical protein ADK38_14945 [Streptomyces varsoviensis]|uniref:Uncharacterized protein n=1 Tax=Streptomyces varsoviensis TaxID=67373 RepID=A0ABR5J872_9ACTN|nr:hypothetical protein ADK38_14945 [Streptomyces varsoviensis]